MTEVKSKFITMRLTATEERNLKELAAKTYHSRGALLRHLLALAIMDPTIPARLGAEAGGENGYKQ